jgi:hypothetical protein
MAVKLHAQSEIKQKGIIYDSSWTKNINQTNITGLRKHMVGISFIRCKAPI